MNSKNIVAIKDEKIPYTCMHCLKEHDKKEIHMIHIPQMGYGSGFDGFDTIIFLCDECYKESIKDIPGLWDMYTKSYTIHNKKNDHLTNDEKEEGKTDCIFKEEYKVAIDMQHDVIYDHDFDETWDEYMYEKEMFEYIKSLPLQSQELIHNRLAKGMFDHGGHNPQEWIDYELGELSHDVCKKNLWVSPHDIKAYHERYEKCNHVVNVVYKDGYKKSECFIRSDVVGEYGGKCSGTGYGCYDCPHFEEKKGEMKTVERK